MPVELTVEAGVAVLHVDHPPVNALSIGVLGEIDRLVTQVAGDDQIAAVVITSSGTKAFLAGADITELPAMRAPGALENHLVMTRRLFDRLDNLRQPTIAAVHAPALGGGLEVALCCDLIFADETAMFGFPEVGLGLIPGAGGGFRLARRAGMTRAVEWVLRGHRVDAADALAQGVVSVVTPAGTVVDVAMKEATRLASLPVEAVQGAKRVLRHASTSTPGAALDAEEELFAELFRSDDFARRVETWLERRTAGAPAGGAGR